MIKHQAVKETAMNLKLFAFGALVLLLGFLLERSQRTVQGNPLTHPSLEGTWILQESGGPSGDWLLTVHGDRARVARNDYSEWYRGQFDIVEDGRKGRIDFHIQQCLSPEGEGLTCLGIYEIRGRGLQVAMGAPGDRSRPVSLTGSRGARIFKGKRK
jgi:hypothetical protein